MDNMADNAYASIGTPEETAPDTSAEDTGVAAGNVSDSAESSAPAKESSEPDVTRTQAFAKRLNERTDSVIASAGLINPYNGKRVMNAADLRALQRMQEAEANGRDPETAAGEAELMERLADYQFRDQERAILDDPELAPYYDEYRDDVLAIADGARANGSDVDLNLALRIVMAQNFGDIRRREAERIRQEVTKNYDAKTKASPGSVSGGTAATAPDFANMSAEDFEKYVAEVKQGRRHVGQ